MVNLLVGHRPCCRAGFLPIERELDDEVGSIRVLLHLKRGRRFDGLWMACSESAQAPSSSGNSSGHRLTGGDISNNCSSLAPYNSWSSTDAFFKHSTQIASLLLILAGSDTEILGHPRRLSSLVFTCRHAKAFGRKRSVDAHRLPLCWFKNCGYEPRTLDPKPLEDPEPSALSRSGFRV